MKFFNTKSLIFFFKLFILTVLMWFLVRSAQIKVGLLMTFCLQGWFLLIIISLFITMICIGAWRWSIINAALGIKLGCIRAWMSSYLGSAFNNLLPGSVGGDFVRFYYVSQRASSQKSSILLAIIIDRLMGLLGVLVAICLIAISHIGVFNQERPLFSMLFLCAAFCLSGLLIFMAFMILPKKMGLINWLNVRFSHRVWANHIVSFFQLGLWKKFKVSIVIKCLLLSVLIQSLIAASLLIIAKIMGLPVISFSDYALAIGITQIVNLIPLTPGGVGVGEIAFANVLLVLNPGIGAAFATVLLGYRLIGVLIYLPGVICYISTVTLIKQKKVLQES